MRWAWNSNEMIRAKISIIKSFLINILNVSTYIYKYFSPTPFIYTESLSYMVCYLFLLTPANSNWLWCFHRAILRGIEVNYNIWWTFHMQPKAIWYFAAYSFHPTHESLYSWCFTGLVFLLAYSHIWKVCVENRRWQTHIDSIINKVTKHLIGDQRIFCFFLPFFFLQAIHFSSHQTIHNGAHIDYCVYIQFQMCIFDRMGRKYQQVKPTSLKLRSENIHFNNSNVFHLSLNYAHWI